MGQRVVRRGPLHQLVSSCRGTRDRAARDVPSASTRRVLLSIGLDPHAGTGRWYVYEFFPATLAVDLGRFPSRARRIDWIEAAGFTDVAVRVAERLRFSTSFEEACRNGILEQSFTSQLTGLSPPDYAAGVQRIRHAAEKDGGFRLEVDLALYTTEARKPV